MMSQFCSISNYLMPPLPSFDGFCRLYFIVNVIPLTMLVEHDLSIPFSVLFLG